MGEICDALQKFEENVIQKQKHPGSKKGLNP